MRSLDARTLPLRGRHLVEASAGTGKTWTIATLFVRLVVELGESVDRILVVTYTKAATAELRDRLRRRLREALLHLDGAGPADDPVLADIVAAWSDREGARGRLEGALRDFDLAPVVTIHSFCQRALRENAFESGAPFDVELIEDDQVHVATAAQDLWTQLLWQADRTFVDWLTSELSWREVLDLVRTGARAARPRLLPDPPPAGLGGAMEALRAAYAELRKAWEGHGRPLEAAVLGCRSLNATSYGAASVGKRRARLDNLLHAGRIGLGDAALWDAVEFFDPERMATRLKKGTSPHDLPDRPELAACRALVEAKARALDAAQRERVRVARALVEGAPEALARVKRVHGDGRFFDDLIRHLAEALADPVGGARLGRALRARFPVALIDEFQDTDPVQWAVFSAIHPRGTEGTLFLIGDPKQAIYAFRGADLHAYLAAAREVGAEGGWSLEVNHRSDAALVEAVNQLFLRVPDPFGQEGITYPEVKARHTEARIERAGAPVAPLQLRVQPAQEDGRGRRTTRGSEVPDLVATEIVALLDGDHTIEGNALEPGHVAVLVSTNYEGRAVQEALRRRGVPSVRHGTQSVLGSDEARQLLALMEAATRPNDLRAVRAAWVTPLIGATAHDLHTLEADEGKLQTALQELRAWRDTWESRGFMRMFQRLAEERGALARLVARDGGDRRVTNLRHLAELVHAEEQGRALRPLGCVAWLSRAIQQAGEAAGDAEMRLESDAAAVQIVTMHKSKGLEYPVVFCPYLWRSPRADRFPTWHDGEGMVLQLHPEADDEGVARRHAEARSEALRLAYVALTRARHLCVVHWGAFAWSFDTNHQDFAESPLAHLLHPPEGRPGGNAEAVHALDDRGLFEAAKAWADTTGGRVDVAWASEASPRRWRPADAAAVQRPPSLPGPRAAADARLASFSALVKAAHELPPDGAQARDVDAQRGPVPEAPPAELPLAGFPGGARPGTAFHAMMEHLDFAAVREPHHAEPVVRAQLMKHGLDPELTPLVSAAIVGVLDTPLGDAPPLAHVGRGDRLDELEFAISVGEAAPLVASRLASAFRRALPPHLAAPVADRLDRLGFVPLAGALRGFVDLVFRHEGRWWLVDYKTNDLGPTLDAYDAPGLDRAMIEGDYVLQYHLYAVALRRHLARRIPGFDWDRDVGGVRYLFVRGMTPASGAARGVFVDRPDAARLDALDRALAGGGP